jgi:hypothetical protein
MVSAGGALVTLRWVWMRMEAPVRESTKKLTSVHGLAAIRKINNLHSKDKKRNGIM